MRKLFSLLLCLLSLASFSQGDQTIIQIPGVEPAILHLPVGYTAGAKYPLLVFLHGKGEGGTNPATIYNSSSAGGPAYFISQGAWPSSLPLLVVSPQFPSTTTGTSPAQLETILQYLVKTYAVDITKIYLTGISEGGAAVTNYITHTGVVPSFKIAAAVIMSAAIGQPSQTQINQITADKVNVWGFGSMSDIFGIQTKILVSGAFSGNGGTLVGLGTLGRFTSYTGGHCCWNPFYAPTYVENGVNIYQWMMQFPAQKPNQPPVANAGASQTITLPLNSVTLDCSKSYDPDGTIISCTWTLKSGPNVPTVNNGLVSNLIVGTYVFTLTVIDNQGATGSGTITVIVNPLPKTVIFSIKLLDGKTFTLYSDGSYTLQ